MSEKTFAELLEELTNQSRAMDAPLGARLKIIADEVRRLSPEFIDCVDRLIVRLGSAGVGQNAPSIGETMPTFILPDERGG